MNRRDPFEFRKFLKKLVRCMQGLVRYSEFREVEEVTPAAALRSLAKLMKTEFEDDYLGTCHPELASRLYESWQSSQRLLSLRKALQCSHRLTQSLQLKTLIRWQERSRLFPSVKSSRRPAILTPVIQSSEPRPQVQHLNSAVRTAADSEISSARRPRHSGFCPSANTSIAGKSTPAVFERLSYDGRSQSAKSLTTVEREAMSCSFAPTLTAKQMFTVGKTPSELFGQSGLVQRKLRKLQLEARKRELEGCSFVPRVRTPGISRSTSFTSTASSKSVFDKLYEVTFPQSHNQSQRRLREKALQQAKLDIKEVTFRPKVNKLAATPPSSAPVSDRLFADFRKREEKLAALREQYSQVESHRRTGECEKGEVPVHERLYSLGREKDWKRTTLTERVMMEEGVTFAPRLFGK